MLIDLMLKSYLPLEWYPDIQIGDTIKLSKRDIEFSQTMVHDENLTKYGNIYLVVEYVLDDAIIGALCQETDLEIKMGFIDPCDYKVVGLR